MDGSLWYVYRKRRVTVKYSSVTLRRGIFPVTKVMCVYLQDLLVKLQALTLNEVVSGGRDLIRQVPQSSKCKIQSGVNHPHHGLLLHNGQQLLRDRRHQKKNR